MNIKHFLLLFPLSLSSFNINSTIWHDSNQDWEQNNGEVGYPNATIELYSGDGIKLSDTTSDANGAYQFNDLSVGEYTVKVLQPENGIVVTLPTRELWLEEDRADINFGLYNNVVNNEEPFILYEDAEDNQINRWTKVNSGAISNIIDATSNSRTINFQSNDLYSNPYTLDFNNNHYNFNIKWDIKTTEGFMIDVVVNTANGERYLRYNDAETTTLNGDTLTYGLGYTPTTGAWFTVDRDLEKDLKNLEPNNQLLSVDSFHLRANAKIDNIELYTQPSTLYEDAEDGLSTGWSIYGGDNTATISNVNDANLNSKVISLQGNSYDHQYIMGGDYVGEAEAWNDTKNTNIQWSMQNSDGFVISLVINTVNGVRYINYDAQATNISSLTGDTLHFGLGENASNGEWHTYVRDIKADLLKLEPNNELLSVEGFIVVGNMKIDNLELFHVLHPTTNQAGISLTFDDTTIEAWHALIPLFTKYDAKGTFFISHFYSLEADRIAKLKALETAGSEIGGHTYDHKGVLKDFNNDTTRITEYIEEQIKTSYDQMIDAGFNPVSFAYPYGEHHILYDAAVRAYFPYIRLTFDDFQNDLAKQAAIYHNSNSNYILLAGAGIDEEFNNSLAEVEAALLEARKKGSIITFYAHNVLDDPNEPYNILPETLENIIEKASNIGLKFYTYKEAYQIGNQNP